MRGSLGSGRYRAGAFRAGHWLGNGQRSEQSAKRSGSQPSGPPACRTKGRSVATVTNATTGMEADNAKPTMLQPEHSADPDKIAERVAGATPQTMPSTISAENAAMDKLPIIACSCRSATNRRSKIAASLRKRRLPRSVRCKPPWRKACRPMCDQRTDAGISRRGERPQCPTCRATSTSSCNDRVLIVDPPFWTVVGEIKK